MDSQIAWRLSPVFIFLWIIVKSVAAFVNEIYRDRMVEIRGANKIYNEK